MPIQQVFARLVLATLMASLAACQTVMLVPGADLVRLTHSSSDVSNCKVVGNVSSQVTSGENAIYSTAQLRNQAIGLGGNVVLLTTSSSIVGVAYLCQ
jgi:hypothetical protein